jgi:hypothetical protein
MCKVVNVKTESYQVYIGRNPKFGNPKWGNPYSYFPNTLAKYLVKNRAEAVEAYRIYITEGEGKHLLNYLHELKGKTLGCHCNPLSCHGDVLKELIELHCV